MIGKSYMVCLWRLVWRRHTCSPAYVHARAAALMHGACAQHAVTKAAAPDYNQYVPAAKEMTLELIERRLKGAKYSSGAALRADVAQIAANAAAYNAPGCGRYGGPGAGPMHALTEGSQELLVDVCTSDFASLRALPAGLTCARMHICACTWHSRVLSGMCCHEHAKPACCMVSAEPVLGAAHLRGQTPACDAHRLHGHHEYNNRSRVNRNRPSSAVWLPLPAVA